MRAWVASTRNASSRNGIATQLAADSCGCLDGTLRALAGALMLLVAGCGPVHTDRSAGTVTHQFAKPVKEAAACFARNAEEHSSALMAEVGSPDARGHVQVIVRVKNGVMYASADLRPMGQRSEGAITLMAISPKGTRELLRSLVEGC